MLDREAKPSVPPKEKVESIIDRFIENEPGITRAKTTGIVQGDLAKESNKPQDEELLRFRSEAAELLGVNDKPK